MPILFAPTVGAALVAPILVPVGSLLAYHITRAVDLRVPDRHPDNIDVGATGFILNPRELLSHG